MNAADDYNIDTYFRAIHDAERGAFPSISTRVGTPAPSFDLPLLGGGSCSLAQLREQGHAVLIFGSFTAPPIVAQLPALEALHRTYGGRGFAFLFVYTREIHPGENLPPHGSMEQKLDQARQMREYGRITLPIAADDLGGTVHRIYGGLPSMAIIVHRDGTIVYRASWAEASLIRTMLEDLLRRDHAEADRPMGGGAGATPWRTDDRGRLIYNESITFMQLESPATWGVLDLAGPKARADVMAGEHPANELLQAREDQVAMAAALDGIRVVEIANYVAGPYAGMLLGDLGAEITKVEIPPQGDPYRAWEAGTYSSAFYAHNRNKRSIVLDLRTRQGRDVVISLLDRADVLIENSRVGAMERLGLGHEAVRERNPRLVYCSITGFGTSGPYVDRPGYDTLGQAMSGLLGQLTDLEDPEPVGISLSDHLAGIFAAYGVLGALMARERSGVGQYVDTSLLQASTAVVAENLTRYLASGEALTRASRARTAQVFAFKDRVGAPFVIHLSSPDKFWLALLDAVGLQHVAGDARFATREARQNNRETVQSLLDSAFATGTRADWLEQLQAHDVPCAPLSSLDEVVADPQVQHLGLVAEVKHRAEGPMQVLRGGVNLQSTPMRLSAAPTLDEHRDEILEELGFPPGFLSQNAM